MGGRQLAKALRAPGYEIHLHNDHLAEGVDDVTWMEFAAKRGWIAITRDKRIRGNTLERQALKSCGLGAFFISSGQLTGDQIRDRLLRFLPAMIAYVHKNARPFLVTVTGSGLTPLK